MSRDYFNGCADVPLFPVRVARCQCVSSDAIGESFGCSLVSGHAGDHRAEMADGVLITSWSASTVTLADVVRAIDARRDLSTDQLTLPDELMPRPIGALFA